MRYAVQFGLVCASLVMVQPARADQLPFQHQVDVYRNEEGDVVVFAMRLEQAFLAEEFEKSNYLRLKSTDGRAYLIYPKETRFQQKHAEFYGRLKGPGPAKLTLSYEVVSENIDGSRKVDVRQAEITVPYPTQETGSENTYRAWARQQNAHFADLLAYYPEETFFQYVVLQSQEKYGVSPPPLSTPGSDDTRLEQDLYHIFSGGLTIQQSLQREILQGGRRRGDLTTHVSQLTPPRLKSLPYEDLLEQKRDKEGVEPKPHEIAKLVPEDQYFLQMNSMHAADELMDLSGQWGDSLLRLVTVHAREQHLKEKLEDQLCLTRAGIRRLFDEDVISELAVTGSDIFVAEGSDLTVIFRLRKPDAFRKAADEWLDEVRKKHPNVNVQEFNYRGQKISARYTIDRTVSSFVVNTGDYVVFSNSQTGIRKVVQTVTDAAPSLHEALDYQYVTTLLPPPQEPNTGYLYASEAFLKRMVSPEFKISEKRRLECFNNLVMLNNASLFFRLEHGRSPRSLGELIEGHFVSPEKLVCPHGGAYGFDAQKDTCTCSMHNRLKYLTPNPELTVLNVSREEASEYQDYKRRYEATWREYFDPLAIRLTVDSTITLDTCVLPFANGTTYRDFKNWFDEKPQPLQTGDIAPSALLSAVLVPGRRYIADSIKGIPGVVEVLESDPTLTDLSWLGDRLGLHLCDDDMILEIDPMKIHPLNLFMRTSVFQQMVAATCVAATSLPVYVTIDVEDREKAERLLDELASRIFLKQDRRIPLPTEFDAYQLPEYKNHAVYSLSYQVYALKLRLYVALVGDRIVAATTARTLREVIDASGGKPPADAPQAHALLRLNRRALNRLKEHLQVYWAEKSRKACHRNVMSIYNLVKLYDVPVSEVDKLSDAKYGVTYICPDGGTYHYDAERERVLCDVHGDRQEARQLPTAEGATSFDRFINSINEIVATLRFNDEALFATVEIDRPEKDRK